MTYNPEMYLESTLRELEKYAKNGFDKAVPDQNLDPVGLYAYQVIMQFPGDVISDIQTVPLPKTIIHFELDDAEDRVVGIGDNIFEWNYSGGTETVSPQEASQHQLNFDVGIWASDVSGGTTSRLRAQQILKKLFVGSLAQKALDLSADGGDGRLEILRYHGGQFVTERVNEINTYRMVGAELEMRVFSRTPHDPALDIQAIEGIVINELDVFTVERQPVGKQQSSAYKVTG